MKLEIVLVLLFVISCSVGLPGILDCILGLEDFTVHNWRTQNTLRYAEDSSQLPGVLNGDIVGRGIFYAGGSQGAYQRCYKAREYFVNIRPAYIYVKCQAHIENTCAATGQNLVKGDFLLVDTIILAQGANISSIDEIKALCLAEIEPTTITRHGAMPQLLKEGVAMETVKSP